jgi:large subunit ribosomal protein L21
MAYAIISLGGKQYRVQEGERLLVDRLKQEEGNTLSPAVLMVGGDGPAQMSPKDVAVTARVVRHLRGDKIVIGKYRQRTGYRRHTGFRAALTQIEIVAIGKAKAAAPKMVAAPAPAQAAPPAEAAAPEPEAPKGMPQGYEDMTVAEINEGAKTWNRPMLEAALEYEQAHAKRKGALAAIESAIAKKEED